MLVFVDVSDMTARAIRNRLLDCKSAPLFWFFDTSRVSSAIDDLERCNYLLSCRHGGGGHWSTGHAPRREDDAKMGVSWLESYATRLKEILIFASDDDHSVYDRCVEHSDLHCNLTVRVPLCQAMNVKSKRFAPLK